MNVHKNLAIDLATNKKSLLILVKNRVNST